MAEVFGVRGVSEEVRRAVRIRAAETGETMGDIVEKALRKELGMVALTWQVIEDNGGVVVADQDGIYYDRMGGASRSVFGGEYDGYEIRHHILGGNVLTESGDEHGAYDEASSVAKLAEMTEAALKESFPRAAVEVTYELNVSGGDGRDLYVIDTADDHARYEPGDHGDGGRIADEARDVVGRVWESWDWIVYESR